MVGKSSITLHEFLQNTVYSGALLFKMSGHWGLGARARETPCGTPTWPHRSHHHRPLTASHEAKAIYRVSVNGHLLQSLCWQLLTFHIICALFLHHITGRRGRWEQKKMQRQLSLRTSWEGHQLGCWPWHLGVHTLLQPAEVVTVSYFRLEEKDSRKEKPLIYRARANRGSWYHKA